MQIRPFLFKRISSGPYALQRPDSSHNSACCKAGILYISSRMILDILFSTRVW